MTITAVIITKNEEKNIKNCLDSVVKVADEIIVLDSFSTDNTATICEAYPSVRFIQKMWSGYAGSKNFANKQANSDYILSLDADEMLSDELQKSILNIKNSNNLNIAYQFHRLNHIGKKAIHHSGWYPDTKIRLFPRSISYWVGEFVHETLVTASNIETLKGDLWHFTSNSIEDWYGKQKKYVELGAKELYEQGKYYSSIEVFFKVIFKFLSIYILKLGFLDGLEGFKLALYSAKSMVHKFKTLNHLKRT